MADDGSAASRLLQQNNALYNVWDLLPTGRPGITLQALVAALETRGITLEGKALMDVLRFLQAGGFAASNGYSNEWRRAEG